MIEKPSRGAADFSLIALEYQACSEVGPVRSRQLTAMFASVAFE